jgi:hypothetical protein
VVAEASAREGMGTMKKIKPVKNEFWNILAWLEHHHGKEIFLPVVRSDRGGQEVCLINNHCGFMGNFFLNKKKDVETINNLFCLWANRGERCTRDCEGNSIFDDPYKVRSE